MEFLEGEWNKPNRTDYYLMRIAQELWMMRNPGKTKDLNEFKIPFAEPKPKTVAPKTEEDKAAHIAASKAKWGAIARGEVKPHKDSLRGCVIAPRKPKGKK